MHIGSGESVDHLLLIAQLLMIFGPFFLAFGGTLGDAKEGDRCLLLLERVIWVA